MKKNLLSYAVAASVAGIAASSQAQMYLNHEGTGEVLLYPYFNAQNGNETSIHIVNTTGRAKAVKVRLMEYINSQEVLDFNLYLSKYDHFSFTIFKNPNGDGGALVTRDNSCTVPELGTSVGVEGLNGYQTEDGAKVQPFLPYAYQTTVDTINGVARTLAGHVEVIEMGDLYDEATATGNIYPATWATHDADGIPANCAGLVAAWDPQIGAWGASTATGLRGVTVPSGGLYGLSNALNNMDAAAFGIEPAAIESWATQSEHTAPGDTLPSLASGTTQSIITVDGAAYTTTWASGIDAVSSLFMSDEVSNDVMVNPAIGGMTDWVITFPTKRFYVSNATAVGRRPFVGRWQLSGGVGAASAPAYSDAKLACDIVGVEQWNREESNPINDTPIFSPPPPPGTSQVNKLCVETNTIAIDSNTSALNVDVGLETGEAYFAGRKLNFLDGETEGWMRMDFKQAGNLLTGASASNFGQLRGLPLQGFAAYKYVNGDRSFGFASDHKTHVAGSAVNRPIPE